jgi:hypothetical protein
MERNDVIKRFNKSGEIGTRTSGWDGLFRFKPSIIFFTTKTCVLSGQANWPNEWAENGTLANITFFGTFPSRSYYKYLRTSFEKQKTDIQY